MCLKVRDCILFSTVIIIGVFLTLLTIHHYPVFNPDGALYLRSAQIYLHRGFGAALAAYNWPLYYVVIAHISQLFHLSLLRSAYCVNAFFIVLSPIVFICIIRELSKSTAYDWWAVLVYFAFHSINLLRADVIRGHGYWFFFLLSALFLMRFSRSYLWRDAFLWTISIALGFLFRIEGVAFIILMPFVIFFFQKKSWIEKIYLYVKLNCLMFFLGLIFIVCLFLGRHEIEKFRFNVITDRLQFILSLPAFYAAKSATFIHYIFPGGRTNATTILGGGLIVAYLLLLIETISAAYLITALWAVYRRSISIAYNVWWVLIGLLSINLLICLIEFIRNAFLSSRYIVATALVVMFLVPFGLKDLHEQFRRKTKFRWLFYLVVILMCMMMVGSLHRFGPSKNFIVKTVQWIKQNTTANAKIYTNEGRILFMANRKGYGWNAYEANYFPLEQLNNQNWKNYNYLALVFSDDNSNLINGIVRQVGMPPVKTIFYPRRGDRVLIFQLKNQ